MQNTDSKIKASYEITDNCTGCTACARSCPVYAISGNRKEKHSINEERCINCGVCGRICAFEAILDEKGVLASRVARSQWLKPKINGDACTGCAICVDICQAQALSLSLPKYQGDIEIIAELSKPKKCVDCKLCEIHCPMGAITMQVAEEIL